MESRLLRISDRTYSRTVSRALQVIMGVALVVFGLELTLIAVNPELGLRLLWFATIPLAPMILLVAPNAWVSICPISTLQTWTHRLGRNPTRRLSPAMTQRLQVAGWVLMLAGIPTRHLVFNSVGWATFWTALAISGLVLAAGLTFKSLSGWCVGACPIRPIEVLYGQFAVDRNRPEKCSTCTACIPTCLRLVPEKSHKELMRSRLVGSMAMGFPGFVASYFLLDLLNICNTEHQFLASGSSVTTNWVALTGVVYGVMFGGFGISWLVFYGLSRLGLRSSSLFKSAAIAAYSAYYLGVSPEICEAWGWPTYVTSLLLILPATAVLWVMLAARRRVIPQP